MLLRRAGGEPVAPARRFPPPAPRRPVRRFVAAPAKKVSYNNVIDELKAAQRRRGLVI